MEVSVHSEFKVKRPLGPRVGMWVKFWTIFQSLVSYHSCFYSSFPVTTSSNNGGEPHPICGTSPGLKPDPQDCAKFYSCAPDGLGGWLIDHMTCSNGLLFDQERLFCNWAHEVSCNIPQIKAMSSFKCPGEGFFPDGQSNLIFMMPFCNRGLVCKRSISQNWQFFSLFFL